MVVWFGILLPSQASSLVSNGIGSVVRYTYPLVCSSEKIPIRWQYVIVWGGLRGALALPLALSLDSTLPDCALVLDLTFGVVVFSILVQGLTIRPLGRILRLASGS
jgi:NhaP-type Na+/H+ or K+/H+ antiporter